MSFYDLIKACEPWHLRVSWYDQKQSRTLWLKSNNLLLKFSFLPKTWKLIQQIIYILQFCCLDLSWSFYVHLWNLSKKTSRARRRLAESLGPSFTSTSMRCCSSWATMRICGWITWRPKFEWFLGLIFKTWHGKYLMSPGETLGKHWVIGLNMGEFSASK